MVRQRAECGTDAAYRRHLKEGETPDEACRDAHAAKVRESRRLPTVPAPVASPDEVDESIGDDDASDDDDLDDMKLIVDTLRTAFKTIAEADPLKLAPIAREFRAAVESTRGKAADQPKELSLAEQLAEVRRARAARTSGSVTSA